MKNNKAHILLIEDDVVDVENIKRAFRVHGVTNIVHVTSTGRAALNVLTGNGSPVLNPIPKIILLDLHLPDMGGLEFLKEIRKDDRLKACSVFVMTTSNAIEDVANAYNLNVAGYIVKPLHHGSFSEIIETLHSFWDLIELPS